MTAAPAAITTFGPSATLRHPNVGRYDVLESELVASHSIASEGSPMLVEVNRERLAMAKKGNAHAKKKIVGGGNDAATKKNNKNGNPVAQGRGGGEEALSSVVGPSAIPPLKDIVALFVAAGGNNRGVPPEWPSADEALPHTIRAVVELTGLSFVAAQRREREQQNQQQQDHSYTHQQQPGAPPLDFSDYLKLMGKKARREADRIQQRLAPLRQHQRSLRQQLQQQQGYLAPHQQQQMDIVTGNIAMLQHQLDTLISENVPIGSLTAATAGTRSGGEEGADEAPPADQGNGNNLEWFPHPWSKALLFGSSAIGGSVEGSDVDVLLLLGASIAPHYTPRTQRFFNKYNAWPLDAYYASFPQSLEAAFDGLLAAAVRWYADGLIAGTIAVSSSSPSSATALCPAVLASRLLSRPLPKVHVTPVTAARVPVLKFVFCGVHADVVMAGYCPPLRWFGPPGSSESDASYPFSRRPDRLHDAVTPGGDFEGDGLLFRRHVEGQMRLRVLGGIGNALLPVVDTPASLLGKSSLDEWDLRAVVAAEASGGIISPPSASPIAAEATTNGRSPPSLPDTAAASAVSGGQAAAVLLARQLLLTDLEEAIASGGADGPAGPLLRRAASPHAFLCSAAWLIYRRIPLASMRGSVNGVRTILLLQRSTPPSAVSLAYSPPVPSATLSASSSSSSSSSGVTASGRLDASKTPTSLSHPLSTGSPNSGGAPPKLKISDPFPAYPLASKEKVSNAEGAAASEDGGNNGSNGSPTTLSRVAAHAAPNPSPPPFSFYSEVFTVALRFIKVWARRRGLYGNLYGYAPGVAWAILAVRGAQLTPSRYVSVVLRQFFKNVPRLLDSIGGGNSNSGGGGGGNGQPQPLRVTPVFVTKSLFVDADNAPQAPSRIAGLMEAWRPMQSTLTSPSSPSAQQCIATSGDALPIVSPSYPFGNSAHTASANGRRIILEEFRLAAAFLAAKPIRARPATEGGNDSSPAATSSSSSSLYPPHFPVNSLVDLATLAPPYAFIRHPSYDVLSAVRYGLAQLQNDQNGDDSKERSTAAADRVRTSPLVATLENAEAFLLSNASAACSTITPPPPAAAAATPSSSEPVEKSNGAVTAPLTLTPLPRRPLSLSGGYDAFLLVDACVSLRVVRRCEQYPNAFYDKLFGVWAGFVESRVRFLVYALEGIADRDAGRRLLPPAVYRRAHRRAAREKKRAEQERERQTNGGLPSLPLPPPHSPPPPVPPPPPAALVGLAAVRPYGGRMDRKVAIDANNRVFAEHLSSVNNCGTMAIGLKFTGPAIDDDDYDSDADSDDGDEDDDPFGIVEDKGQQQKNDKKNATSSLEETKPKPAKDRSQAAQWARRQRRIASADVAAGIAQLLQPAVNDFLFAVESACAVAGARPYAQRGPRFLPAEACPHHPANTDGGRTAPNPLAFVRDPLMLGPFCRLLTPDGEARFLDFPSASSALSSSSSSSSSSIAATPLPIVTNNDDPVTSHATAEVAAALALLFTSSSDNDSGSGAAECEVVEVAGVTKAERRAAKWARKVAAKRLRESELEDNGGNSSGAPLPTSSSPHQQAMVDDRPFSPAEVARERAAMALLRRSQRVVAESSASPSLASGSPLSPALRLLSAAEAAKQQKPHGNNLPPATVGRGGAGEGLLPLPPGPPTPPPPPTAPPPPPTAAAAGLIIDGVSIVSDVMYPRCPPNPSPTAPPTPNLGSYGRALVLQKAAAVHRQDAERFGSGRAPVRAVPSSSHSSSSQGKGQHHRRQQQQQQGGDDAGYSSNVVDYFDYVRYLPEELCVPLS